MSTQPAPATDSQPRSLGVSHVLATVILIASLLLVLVYWSNVQERGLRDAEADFQFSNRQVIRLLQQRLTHYELLVRGAASLHASLPQPSRTQWRHYVEGLDIQRRFPSVRALGFALDVSPEQLAALQLAMPGLVWDVPAEAGAAAPGGLHATVLYVAPLRGDNLRIPGIDLAQDPGRHAALERSAAERALRISRPVPPVLGGRVPGTRASDVAVYAPVYAEGTAKLPPAQALRGWVFLEVETARSVQMALQALEREGRLRLVDVGDGEERVLHTEPGFLGSRAEALPRVQRPAFVQSVTMDVFGRRWRVDFESAPLAEVRDTIPGVRSTLLGGVAGSLLVFGIALSLARTQVRAQALAARLSESYRRSEQRFRAAMQYSAIGKALLDHEGRILEANPALAQILGTSQDALAGTMLGEHFAEGERDSMRTVEREALAGGAYRVTRRLIRSDGDVRHASLTFAMVPSDEGQGFSSLVQVDDVTERLRAEARIQALNRTLEARVALRTRELSHANRELEAFAYSVSHDLRAPLRSIDGFSRLLAERYRDVVDESGRDYLQRIRNASARMSELIDALLKMSRVSRGELKYAEVDLSAIAREVAAELRNGEPGRRVEFDIEPGVVVHGDPALLRNLMDNLLGNAWKFTRGRDDARIAVGIGADNEIYVRDNGAGFSPEYAAKLFRPFQRLHSETEYAGHGIGLATVKRIVERHGGSIRAEGAVGQGATFRFSLGEHPVE